MHFRRNLLVLLLVSAVGLAGCETLKSSKAIIPMKEYERMIAGRLDAN